MQATIVNQIIDYSQTSDKQIDVVSKDNAISQNKNFDDMVKKSTTEKQNESEISKEEDSAQFNDENLKEICNNNTEQKIVSNKSKDNDKVQKKETLEKSKKEVLQKTFEKKGLLSESEVSVKNEKQNILNESLNNTSKIVKNSESDKKNISKELGKDKISLKRDNEIEKTNLSEDKFKNLVQNPALTSEFNSGSSISKNKEDIAVDEMNVKSFRKKEFSFDKDGKITVSDYRTSNIKENDLSDSNDKKTDLKISNVKFTGNNSAEITMDLSNVENTQANILSSNSQLASADGSNFQAMLSNQIQQNAQDFVKTGNIILKDNDIGQIKLILNPESLGNVKIDLQISDKNITGRIVVASQEAYNAFKESADTLKQAFINSGFETAGFDLSFAGQDASSNQFAHNRNDDAQIKMSKVYGDYTTDGYSENDEINENIQISSKNAINIVA